MTQLANPDVLNHYINNYDLSAALSGLIPGMFQNLSLALCPLLFKCIAVSGSNATTLAGAGKRLAPGPLVYLNDFLS